MAPSIERPDPPYLQIVRQITEQIQSGELAPGSPVPSTRQIRDTYGVAMATAGRVIRKLTADGLIVTEAGKAATVAQARTGPQAYAVLMQTTGRIYPPGNYARIISADLLEGDLVPERIIDALDLEPGARVVIRRERVTHGPDHRALSTSVSWFDGALADVAPLLLQAERIKSGTAAYIAQTTGRGPSTRGKVMREASRATEAEAATLDINVDDPVLRGSNWYLDADGGVIEYGESVAVEGLLEAFEYTLNSTEKG
jgi:DNA-binding GntR family transcriptional regulator